VIVPNQEHTVLALPSEAQNYQKGLLLNDDDECFVKTHSLFGFKDLRLLSDSTYKPALSRMLIWTEVFERVKSSSDRK